MLAERIRTLAASRRPPDPIDARPGCTFGAVVGQRLTDLDQVVGRLETKLNALLGGLALFLAVEIIKAVRP